MAVTVGVIIYVLTSERSGGDERKIAVVMLVVIAFLSFLCTMIDYVRRKFFVERPVRRILDATERIAAGDFSCRLDISHAYRRYDEYDCIMANLNEMAEELSKTQMLRNDFVSNVSHEIKTPLAVIQNYAACLQTPGLSEEARGKYAETIASAAKRLTTLVVNMLKLNKLENQQIPPDKEKVRLDESIAECVLSMEDLIEKKNIAIECDLEEVSVVASASYLEIVWNNLLSNAVKFTPEGGRIAVSLKDGGDRAVVRVSDTGVGISPETGRHIFEKFYQGDASHAQEGNGLGLALVKKVIDKSGGEIAVESEVGKGSTFTIVLKKE